MTGLRLYKLTNSPVLKLAGNSTKATSGINGAGTKAQAALGIPDTPKAFFDDTKESVRNSFQFGPNPSSPATIVSLFWALANPDLFPFAPQARDLARDDLIEVLTGRSGDAVNWLMDKFGLDLSKVSRLGGHSFERTHRGKAQFPGMTITVSFSFVEARMKSPIGTNSNDRAVRPNGGARRLCREGAQANPNHQESCCYQAHQRRRSSHRCRVHQRWPELEGLRTRRPRHRWIRRRFLQGWLVALPSVQLGR